MKVLYIEPNINTEVAVTSMLENSDMGCDVTTVDFVQDVLGEAAHGDYDLLLVEVAATLPVDANGQNIESGHDVIKRLRQDGNNIPILVLSYKDSTEDKLKAFGNGADDYLVKPFHKAELFARIKAIIERCSRA